MQEELDRHTSHPRYKPLTKKMVSQKLQLIMSRSKCDEMEDTICSVVIMLSMSVHENLYILFKGLVRHLGKWLFGFLQRIK